MCLSAMLQNTGWSKLEVKVNEKQAKYNKYNPKQLWFVGAFMSEGSSASSGFILALSLCYLVLIVCFLFGYR